MLTHWQTYGAALLFLSFSMGSKFLTDELYVFSAKTGATTQFISRLLLTLGHVAGIIVFVNIMCPIMLGFSVYAAWSWPLLGLASDWDVMRFFAGIGCVAAIVSGIPILGRSPSLFVLVIGSLALVPTLEMLDSRNAISTDRHIQFWPGFWFMAAVFSIGSILTWLCTMLAVMPSLLLKGRAKRIGTLFAYPFGAAFGFIPLFIYCAWLRGQIGTL
jgi:hypothetical protein